MNKLGIFAFNSQAQLSSSLLTPNNKDEVVESILYSYPYYIGVSEAEVKDFIYASQEGLVPYDPDVAPPKCGW